MELELFPALVVDPGAYTWRVGYAHFPVPTIIDSIVSKCDKKTIVGDQRLLENKNYQHSFPVGCGTFIDWDATETVFDYLFEELKFNTQKPRRILIADSPVCGPKANREKLTEIMFEKYHVDEYSLLPHPTLSVIPTKRISGLVLNCGESCSYSIPVYEGTQLYHAYSASFNASGDGLTRYLNELLNNKFKVSLSTCSLRRLKEFTIVPSVRGSKNKPQKVEVGQPFQLDDECVYSPEHVFFNSTSGVAHLVADSIRKCDPEIIEYLASNIILTGGSTFIPGFVNRIDNEIQALLPNLPVKVCAPVERGFLSWLGGCSISMNSASSHLFISAPEYEESGPSLVHKKCFPYFEKNIFSV